MDRRRTIDIDSGSIWQVIAAAGDGAIAACFAERYLSGLAK
jgi:thioredoxin reductase